MPVKVHTSRQAMAVRSSVTTATAPAYHLVRRS
jgi:hypothetical protein